MLTDWAVVHLQHGGGEDPLDPLKWYCEAVGTHCGARVTKEAIPTGWCSWYEHMDRCAASSDWLYCMWYEHGAARPTKTNF